MNIFNLIFGLLFIVMGIVTCMAYLLKGRWVEVVFSIMMIMLGIVLLSEYFKEKEQ